MKQISKYKDKMIKKNKSNESVRFEMIPEPEEQEEGRVVKNKKFHLTPMTVDEAILQMDMLQHDFFVFLNVETDSVSVAYVVDELRRFGYIIKMILQPSLMRGFFKH
ncbi:MAG: sigma 54 modulation/S30EA ribosomal C-terminal domain-containing protein [Anaerovoracaceae bacterium]